MKELNKGYEFTRAQIAELESLRAWKAEIEKQEPVGEIVRTETSHGCDRTAISWLKYPYAKYGAKLYLSQVVSPDVEKLRAELDGYKEAGYGDILGMSGIHEQLAAENQSLKNEAAAWKESSQTWADKYEELAESFQCHPNKPVIERLKAELAKATSELETARKDAERYRFLKQQQTEFQSEPYRMRVVGKFGEDLYDIDAAIEQAKSCNKLHEKGAV